MDESNNKPENNLDDTNFSGLMPSENSYKVRDIADFFIAKTNNAKIKGETMTNLRLQKLVYYSYVWYLVIFDKKLFEETIEAWQYGPVVNELYHEVKNLGLLTDLESDPDDLDDVVKNHLEAIWGLYSKYSASRLVDLTHEEKPWIEAYNTQSKQQITDEKIISFYKTDEGFSCLPSGGIIDPDEGLIFDKTESESIRELKYKQNNCGS